MSHHRTGILSLYHDPIANGAFEVPHSPHNSRLPPSHKISFWDNTFDSIRSLSLETSSPFFNWLKFTLKSAVFGACMTPSYVVYNYLMGKNRGDLLRFAKVHNKGLGATLRAFAAVIRPPTLFFTLTLSYAYLVSGFSWWIPITNRWAQMSIASNIYFMSLFWMMLGPGYGFYGFFMGCALTPFWWYAENFDIRDYNTMPRIGYVKYGEVDREKLEKLELANQREGPYSSAVDARAEVQQEQALVAVQDLSWGIYLFDWEHAIFLIKQ